MTSKKHALADPRARGDATWLADVAPVPDNRVMTNIAQRADRNMIAERYVRV